MQSIEQVIGSKHKFNKLIVYHTSEAHSINHKLSEMINNFEYDLVLFLSPSAVRSFAKSVSNKTNLQEIKSVPIGITTRQALIDYGTSPVLTPSAPNIETMINELEQYYIQNTN
jgi:uroporphyrinogen-III synthase